MTNLTESPVYETGIYQLETTDPVVGGAPGFDMGVPVTGWSNVQAQQLANRTAYLDINKQPLSDNLTSLASLTGAADNLPYFTGAGALSLTTLTGLARDLLDDTTQSGMQSTLGLVKQTSATDTTQGALVIQGGTNLATLDTVAIGYGTGSGGTVTQATSKSTGVTLNKPSGQITTAADALAANTAVSFTLTNDKIAANDIPRIVIKSGATAGAYVVQVDAVAAGSCSISIRNMTAGSLSETLVLQFNIEKGATA